jgi:hypothetical protein
LEIGHLKLNDANAKQMHVGVVLKRIFRKSQLDVNGSKLQNAEDVIAFLCTHLFSRPETSYIGERKHVTCVFWHVNTIDVDHQTKYTCDFVKGS